MYKKFLYVLCFCSMPAVADVVSTAYVDEIAQTVQGEIDGLVNKDGFEPNLVLQTDSNGNVTAGLVKTDMIADGAIQTMHIADGEITDADLAAGLGLDKLDWGTLPTDGKKYIPIWNAETEEFVFELYKYERVPLQCTAPEYDIGADVCISASITPNKYGYWALSASSASDCTTCKVMGDWEVKYTRGAYAGTTVTGKALCSTTVGTYKQVGNPNESGLGDTRYCYCKLDNKGIVSRWVHREYSYAGDCKRNCARTCAASLTDSSFGREWQNILFDAIIKQ